MTSYFLHGPSYQRLQSEAFDTAHRIADDTPGSVRWLEQNDHRTGDVANAWATSQKPLRLDVTNLDQLVGECYEELTGPHSILDALSRRQLVDQALRALDDAILVDAHRHRDEVMDFFTTIEAEGYDSPYTIEALVVESDISERAATVLETTYGRLAADRDRTMTGGEYTQSQAYQRVLDADQPATELLPDTDVVVLSGYYELSSHQRDVIEWIAESIPVVVVLPLVADLTADIGADTVASDAATFYHDLADETSRVAADGPSPLTDTAGQLYTPTGDPGRDISEETLRWVQAPTPDREIRQVARSIRNRLATDDIDPDDVLVVSPGLISYREHVEDIFPAHGVEAVTFANKLLYQTYAGDAMLDLVTVCEGDHGADLLASLATNPVVTLGGIDSSHVADLARRLPTNDPERLLAELDDPSRTPFEELFDLANQVDRADGANTIDAIRRLFDHVDLETSVDDIGEMTTSFDAQMERRAYRRVDRVLHAIERVARTHAIDDVLERVSDELDQVRVPPPQSTTEGAVEVVGPRDAFMQSYEHLYLVGLTARDFPPNPDRPKFFKDLEDELAGIDPTTDREVARYQFATMLASAESVYITTPETTANDESLLESAVLDELARVTDLEPTKDSLGNGCREDVQRKISQTSDGLNASDAVERAIDAGVFDETQTSRVRRGVECAEHRASRNRTVHDGLIDSETVDALHPPTERKPFSPTRLTQYARCGFQYYMERVLEIEAPEEYKIEPDPLDLGSLVHAILEEFYTDLQEEPGDLVDLSTWDRDELEIRMLEAGERALDDLSLPFDDVFYDRWLEALFAGLGEPGSNNHYQPDASGVHAPSKGLLSRFLDAEYDREDEPGWFEVSMDLSDDPDATLDLEAPDGRTIPIGGRIDRVAVDHTDDPTTGLVHDYKTGNRSARPTVDGVEFQLPLYALAAGQKLHSDGVDTPFDAAFYVLDPPEEVSEKWTLRYYLSRYGDASDADYGRFIETVTPRRVGSIVEGIVDGAFEPTVLDEDTAKCRYCDYSDVCDVRYHRRREAIDAIDTNSRDGYVPRYAREDSLLDEFGGDD